MTHLSQPLSPEEAFQADLLLGNLDGLVVMAGALGPAFARFEARIIGARAELRDVLALTGERVARG